MVPGLAVQGREPAQSLEACQRDFDQGRVAALRLDEQQQTDPENLTVAVAAVLPLPGAGGSALGTRRLVGACLRARTGRQFS